MNATDWVLVGIMALGPLIAASSYVTAVRYRHYIKTQHKRYSEVTDSPLRQVAIGLGFDHKNSV